MSLLTRARELQAKIQKIWNEDPDITKKALATRFGISADRVREFLAPEPVFPTGYKMTAGRIKRPVEEVAENREAGNRWCRHCGWCPDSEFYESNGVAFTHYSGFCTRRKK